MGEEWEEKRGRWEMENGTEWGKGERGGEKKEGQGAGGDTPWFFSYTPWYEILGNSTGHMGEYSDRSTGRGS